MTARASTQGASDGVLTLPAQALLKRLYKGITHPECELTAEAVAELFANKLAQRVIAGGVSFIGLNHAGIDRARSEFGARS